MQYTDDESKFDLRSIPSRLRRGTVKAEELQKYLDGLEDSAAECVQTDTRFIPAYEQKHYKH